MASLSHPTSQRKKALQLVNPSWDTFLLGGSSLILFLFVHSVIDTTTVTASIAVTSYWLTFIINKPHFILSYWLFYKDYKLENWTNSRWWATSLIVPFALILLIFFGFMKSQVWPFQFLVHTMYFLVGWHYIKQVFGIMMFRGQYDNYIFNQWERRWLLLNLGSLWLLNWLAWNRSGQKYQFFQIEYHALILPQWLWANLWVFFTITATGLVGLVFRRYVREGEWPPVSTLAPLIALYCWYIPSFYHPVYFLFIPLFHSLQYMVFAISLKRNQIEKSIRSLEGKEWRQQYLGKVIFYSIVIVLLGTTFFKWLPELLDQQIQYNKDLLGTTLMVGAATLFINIHHYFIDSLLWRKDSPLMRDL